MSSDLKYMYIEQTVFLKQNHYKKKLFMTSKNRTSNNYPMNTNTNTLNSKCAESSCFIYINVM